MTQYHCNFNLQGSHIEWRKVMNFTCKDKNNCDLTTFHRYVRSQL